MRKNPFEIKTRFRIIKPSGFIYAYPILRPQNSYSLNFIPAPISLNSEACFFGSKANGDKAIRQLLLAVSYQPNFGAWRTNAKKIPFGIVSLTFWIAPKKPAFSEATKLPINRYGKAFLVVSYHPNYKALHLMQKITSGITASTYRTTPKKPAFSEARQTAIRRKTNGSLFELNADLPSPCAVSYACQNNYSDSILILPLYL